jgi:hypothetical protein
LHIPVLSCTSYTRPSRPSLRYIIEPYRNYTLGDDKSQLGSHIHALTSSSTFLQVPLCAGAIALHALLIVHCRISKQAAASKGRRGNPPHSHATPPALPRLPESGIGFSQLQVLYMTSSPVQSSPVHLDDCYAAIYSSSYGTGWVGPSHLTSPHITSSHHTTAAAATSQLLH